MKFVITKSSDLDYKEEVEINTLDELKQLQEKYAIPEDDTCWKNPSLIIDFNDKSITVYDYYLEYVMIKEDKELLLKDLSGRLQYGVIVHNSYNYFDNIEKVNKHREVDRTAQINDLYAINEVKPYLRPMSSMTSEECMQLATLLPRYFTVFPEKLFCTEHINGGIINFDVLDTIIDFYNSNHLDWRGLIPKGLALEATKDMYNIKEK